MKLTSKMKKWLVDECNVKATSTDDEFKKAAGTALAAGTLTLEKLTELSTTQEDEEADGVVGLFKNIADTMKDLSKSLKSGGEQGDAKSEGDGTKDGEKDAKPKGEKSQTSHLEKLFTRYGGTTDLGEDEEEKSFDIRVKSAAEQYDDTKSALSYPEFTDKGKAHPLAGKPVKDFSEGSARTIEEASDLGKAVAGAYGKFLVQSARLKSRTLAFQQMPDHDRDLLMHAMQKMNWGGSSDGSDESDIKNRRLTPSEQKALIDDVTSGGIEAAPIVFDDMVIQTPLLNGELFPLVTQVPLDRGRRVEGVSVGNVTGSWGGVDDTAISLFNTASYVAAFDTTIFRWEGAIRLGLDFLSDTPIDFGPLITAQYGERLLEDLDDVIATGNGTTQPEGVMTKSGTTSVSFGGSTSIGNYESLRFGVAKKEHKSAVKASAVFCGTETSYQRVRAIPVGASDARRLGGMDYDSYTWMQRPYKINESLSNSQIFYAILARYRMYRRRGLSMRQSTEGDTLIRNNELLMVAMARYGGQLERGAVAAVTSTAPA